MSEDYRRIAEVLRAAKQELLTRGWCSGAITNPRGEVCTIGAIDAVDDDTHLARATTGFDVRPYVLFAEANAISFTIGSIADWNDAEGRTPEEVLAAFDAAITLAEQREAAAVAPLEVVLC